MPYEIYLEKANAPEEFETINPEDKREDDVVVETIEEDKPGPIVYTSREVEKAIINLEETEALYKPCRDKFRKKFVQYECENSSEKIFNEVFKK